MGASAFPTSAAQCPTSQQKVHQVPHFSSAVESIPGNHSECTVSLCNRLKHVKQNCSLPDATTTSCDAHAMPPFQAGLRCSHLPNHSPTNSTNSCQHPASLETHSYAWKPGATRYAGGLIYSKRDCAQAQNPTCRPHASPAPSYCRPTLCAAGTLPRLERRGRSRAAPPALARCVPPPALRTSATGPSGLRRVPPGPRSLLAQCSPS